MWMIYGLIQDVYKCMLYDKATKPRHACTLLYYHISSKVCLPGLLIWAIIYVIVSLIFSFLFLTRSPRPMNNILSYLFFFKSLMMKCTILISAWLFKYLPKFLDELGRPLWWYYPGYGLLYTCTSNNQVSVC